MFPIHGQLESYFTKYSLFCTNRYALQKLISPDCQYFRPIIAFKYLNIGLHQFYGICFSSNALK